MYRVRVRLAPLTAESTQHPEILHLSEANYCWVSVDAKRGKTVNSMPTTIAAIT